MTSRLRLSTGLDPRLRAALGLAGLLLCGRRVQQDQVPEWEVATFHRVNQLPDQLEWPAWAVMQMGNVAAAPLTAAVAAACGRRQLAGRVLIGGMATWLLAKAVKGSYQRPRPTRLVGTVLIRGEEATGLGYVSGHAGIVAALASATWPELGAAGCAAVGSAVPLVAATRMYVGAHLPLDVLGGAALGVAVQGIVDEVVLLNRGGCRTGHRRRHRRLPGRDRRRAPSGQPRSPARSDQHGRP